MVALTIGMPTYNDFDGVYFTVQALRLYQDLEDTEIVVVDNFGCEHTRKFIEDWVQARYILATEAVGTAAAKNRVFAEARGEAVLCMDSHVRFFPGTIARLKAYYRQHPDSKDLLQGPLVYDDLKTTSTNFDPVWRGQMWGIWATDSRGLDPDGEPFEIWGQGMGVFSCRKEAWPGFHPDFRGFGGEEGYIHEKVRQHGGRVLCLPWLRWVHRFGRPAGVPYQITVADKFRNYLIGHVELGLDLEPVVTHFAEHLPAETLASVTEEVLRDYGVAETKDGVKKEKKQKKKKDKKGGKGHKEKISEGITLAIPATDQGKQDSPATDAGNQPPLVSCICSTYNRPPDHQYLVEEAIESFLRQDYPNKELIVLNDCPGQELVCDAPGVRVVNAPERFPSLGEKHNAAIALSRGELIAIWDDDDISLPWRLSLSVERLGAADYFNPKRYWTMTGDELLPDPRANVGHNLSLYRRAAYEAVGRYPPVGSDEDVALDQAFRRAVKCVGSELVQEGALTYGELYYIYRWGVSPAHLSVSGKTPAERYARVGDRPVQAGCYELTPHWRRDYVAETRQLIAWNSRSANVIDEGMPWPKVKERSSFAESAIGEQGARHTGHRKNRKGREDGREPTRISSSLLELGAATSLPLVSCICPTFNRPPDHQFLVEEAIESFLRQDYPNKELIVLNDCPGQELICEAPGVRIINTDERFPTLGEKRNAAIEAARGELIAPWDDDDISLPWRLSLSVERLGNSDYYNPKNYWFLDSRGMHYDHNLSTAHAKSLFTRSGYLKVGGYPAISLGDDTDLDRMLTELLRKQSPDNEGQVVLPITEWHYIYRWGISPIHTSSRDESGYQEIGSRAIQPGRYILKPRWLVDYESRTRQLIQAGAPIDYLALSNG